MFAVMIAIFLFFLGMRVRKQTSLLVYSPAGTVGLGRLGRLGRLCRLGRLGAGSTFGVAAVVVIVAGFTRRLPLHCVHSSKQS